jgi:hypothetical protein
MHASNIYATGQIPVRNFNGGKSMRSIIVMAMFTASLASGAVSSYEEQRDLSLSASGINVVIIDAGAGNLVITGVPGADEIAVTAMIQVADRDDAKARKMIESDLVLSLEKRGDIAVLSADFKEGGWNLGDNSKLKLLVQMPNKLNLAVGDGSESISVSGVSGAIEFEDDSESIASSTTNSAAST